jgi:hypothetical protein
MKTIPLSTAFLVVLMTLSMASHAVDAQKPESSTDNMGVMGKMTPELLDQHLRAKQEHLLKMHDLSNQILAEKDPAKKEQLKTQQLELMKADHAQRMAHHQGKMKMHP